METRKIKKEQPELSAVRFVDDILSLAIAEEASDIHFEPYDGGLLVRTRVDGALRRVETVPGELGEQVAARLKVISRLDLTERKKPQDGRASVNENVDIRVSTLPTLRGEKVVIRILNKLLRPQGAETLGLEGENLRMYRELLQAGDGLILIAGPTGSGKTSTMYEMITELAREEVNIVTLEDPVEYNIVGTNQVSINEQVGMTFSAGMKSVLRQDPDVIAIGEIRDTETAEIAYHAAISGRLALATVHARSASTLLSRMENIGMKRSRMEETLRGVIIQRLVRRVCGDCGGSGCDSCGGTGYHGRVGVFGIAAFGSEQTVTAEALSGADSALADNCRALAAKGVTTEWEAKHVLGIV